MKNSKIKGTHRLLALLLTLAMLLPMALPAVQVVAAETESAATETDGTDSLSPITTWDFEDEAQLSDFSLYQSGTSSFSIVDGLLAPSGSDGEMKALVNAQAKNIKSVSVDIIPGETGINAGVYLGASDAADTAGQINTLAFLVESNFTGWADAPNRIDVVTGSFTPWTQLARMISETGKGNALYTNGEKKSLNLKLDFDNDNITVTLSLAEDLTKYTQTVYYCDTSTIQGQIGLRAFGSDVSFDNLVIELVQTPEEELHEGISFSGANVPLAQTDSTIAQIPNTIEMWVKINPRTTGGKASYRQPLISSFNPGGSSASTAGDFALFVNASGNLWWYEMTDQSISDTTSQTTNYEWKCLSTDNYLTGEWMHVAVSRQEGQLILYINGEQISQWESAAVGYSAVPTQPITFGYSPLAVSPTQNNLDGAIGDVRLWSSTRTQEEIQQDMYKNIAGTETGLMHYWKFDEQDGTVFKDSVENGINGTILDTYSFVQETGLKFKGISEAVATMGSAVSNIPQAVELWVKIDTNSEADQETLIAAYSGKTQAAAASGDWYLGTTAAGCLRWVEKNANGQSGQMNGSTNIQTGEWTHIAVVRYEGDIKFYINGQEETVTKASGVSKITLDTEKTQSSTVPTLGYCVYNTASYTNYLDGALKDVRLWSTDRTQAQIQADMNKVLTGSEEGLMHYWKLDETAGTVIADSTSANNAGTITGTTTSWLGEARLELPGVNQPLAMVSEPVTQIPKTVEMWVQIDGDSQADLHALINAYNAQTQVAGAGDWQLDVTTGGVLRWVDMTSVGKSGQLKSTTQIPTDEWVHVAVTREDGYVKFYLNGQLDATVAYSTFEETTPSYTTPILGYGIFVTHTGYTSYLDGAIKDVRIWSVTRTGEEIAGNMSQTLTGSEEGLMNYWKMDETEGVAFSDSTASENHGTPTVYWSTAVNDAKEEIVYTNDGFSFAQGLKWETTSPVSATVSSVEAWVKVPTATGDDRRLTVISAFPDSTFHMDIYTKGRPRLYYTNADGANVSYIANVDVRTNEWTHIAWVCDAVSGVVTCYINGEAAYTNTNVGQPVSVYTLYVGRDDRTGWQYPFVGEVADVRVWNKVLTADEVRYSMQTSDMNQAEGLLLDLPLDEADDAETLRDLSANNNAVEVYQRVLNWIDVEKQPSDYSIVIIPDQQILTNYHPEKLNGIYQWIADNAESENMQMVLNVGDITDNNSQLHWERSLAAYNLIAGKVPYICVPGNHDYDTSKTYRDLTAMNQYFPLSMFQAMDTYGGSYSEDNGLTDNVANTWQQFEVNGNRYLVLALEFGPRDSVLEWANEVVAAHPNHQVIVVTHGYMNYDGTWLDGTDAHVPTKYGFTQGETEQANNADGVWDKFVRKHENIIMVLSGHIFASDNVVVRTDIGDNGNEVKQFLIDAQLLDAELGGLGLVAMMNFSNGGQTVEFTYYSPYMGKYMNEENQFTFTLPAPTTYVAETGTQSYDTVTGAIAAANGEAVKLLASTDEAITITGDVTVDLAGNTLSNVTVAEGGSLKLVDTVTGGSATVNGSVETFTEAGGKTYLVVGENGVYTAHEYAIAITHISLDPANDALGYKAALVGDEVVQSHVTGIGFNLWVDGGSTKTYTTTGKQQVTLRLKNILAARGGEMNINATAFVTLTAAGSSATKTCGQQTTTMKRTLQLIDEAWSTYTEAQQTAVKALCDQYYETVSAWQLYNIYPELDDTAVLAETYEAVTGTVLSGTHNGYTVQNGQLLPPGGTGEGKVILAQTVEGDKSVSVDIYPVSGNLINSGIYLGAANAAAAQDSINALTVIVESTVADNPNRVDIVIGNFPAWEQYHRTVIEGDSALFTDGVKEPVNLKVDISGNDLTVTLSLISDPSKSVTVTYTYTGAYDLSAGLVGLRSQYDDSAFDNFKVTNSQQTVEYTFDSDADVTGLEFYHSTWAGGVTATSAQTLALHNTATFTNGTFAADLNTNGNNAAGIVFGADESGESYYLYRLTADRFVELVKIQNGVETVLDKGYLSAGHINTNFNRLEVVKDGNTIYCYYYNRFDKVNCYGVYEDPTPLTGERIGLWSATSGTVFQNVTTSGNLEIREADALIFGHSYTEMWWDYETYFPEYPSIDNIGIGGSVAVHWESLADEVIAYGPKLGIYNIGINDLTGGTTPKAVIDSVEKALLDIKAALPEFEVVLVSVSHCPARSTITAEISETNALMRNLAASYDWIYYAEAEYLFCTDSSDPLSTDASLFIDGLHPSAAGYQLMADVIRSAINGENQPVYDETLAQAQFETAKANKLASLGIYSQSAYTAENWTQAQTYYDAAVAKINACTTEAQLEALDLSEEITALNAIPNKSVDVIANILNAQTRDALNADSWTKTDDNTVNVSGYSYALDNTATYSDMEVVFSASNNTGTVGTGGVFLRATQKDNNGIEGYLVNYVSSGNYMQVYYVNNVYNTDGSSYVLTYLGGVVYGTYGDVIGTDFHVKIEGDKLYLSTLERYQTGDEPLTVVDLTYNGAYEVYESGYIGVLSWNGDVSYDLSLDHFKGE